MTAVIDREKIFRYFRLRPTLTWSLFSFLLLLSLLFIIRWGGLDDSDEDVNFDDFKLVQLAQMPKAITKPDVQVTEEVTDNKIEKEQNEDKPLQFGDDSGDFGDEFDVLVPPRLMFSVLPEYPPSMKKAGVEGVVVIMVGIDEQGKVVFGKIIKTLGREFDLAVVHWIKKQKFYPALDSNRKPFRCRFRLPVRFKLED